MLFSILPPAPHKDKCQTSAEQWRWADSEEWRGKILCRDGSEEEGNFPPAENARRSYTEYTNVVMRWNAEGEEKANERRREIERERERERGGEREREKERDRDRGQNKSLLG